MHVEEAGGGAREDLREPGGAREVVARARVRPPRALEEDDRLEHVGIGPVARGCGVDPRPEAGHARRWLAPPGALRVQHVAEARGGAARERGLLLVLLVGERVRIWAAPGRQRLITAAGDQQPDGNPHREYRGEQVRQAPAAWCERAAHSPVNADTRRPAGGFGHPYRVK